MQNRWFKMPVNTAQNPALALAARRLNQPRALVICAYMAACESACEAPETDILSANALETTAYTLDTDTDTLQAIYGELSARGLLAGGKVAAHEAAPKSDAERKREQREREKAMSQCHAEPVTGHAEPVTGHAEPVTGHAREEEKEETDKNPPTPQGGGEGFENFWKARPSRGNAPDSKAQAAKVYAQLVKRGADEADLLKAMQRYAEWCRGAKKDGTQFAKSAAAFLSEGAFQQYLNQETANAVVDAGLDLPEWQQPLCQLLQPAEVRSWFKGAEFDSARQAILFPKKFHRDWCAEKFGGAVAQAIGNVKMEVRA